VLFRSVQSVEQPLPALVVPEEMWESWRQQVADALLQATPPDDMLSSRASQDSVALPPSSWYGVRLHHICKQGIVSAFEQLERLQAAYRLYPASLQRGTGLVWPLLFEVTMLFAAIAFHAHSISHKLLEESPANCMQIDSLRATGLGQGVGRLPARPFEPRDALGAMATLQGDLLSVQSFGTGLGTLLRVLQQMRHSPERDALCALLGLRSPPAESESEAEGARADGQRATTRPGSSVVFSLVPAIEHAIGRFDLLMGMAENCKLGTVGPASSSGPGDDRAGSPDDMSVGSSPEPEIGDVEMEQVAQGAGLRCDTPGPPAAAEEDQDEETGR